MYLQLSVGRIKHILCDFPGKRLLDTCTWFPWTWHQARFALYVSFYFNTPQPWLWIYEDSYCKSLSLGVILGTLPHHSAKIVVFALRRDGTVGITQLLKVSLNYLLLSLKSLGWEPQMFSGPHEHSQSATPSPPNQDSNIFPRRGKRRREGIVDTESGEPDVDKCPSLPGAGPSVTTIRKHGQFKGIWKQRTWIVFDGLWGGPKTQGGVGRKGLRQTCLTQPCLWIRHNTMLKQSFFLCIYLAVLGLCCCPWAFSCCSEWRLLSSCWVWISHCGGFSCCGAQILGHVGFRSCSSPAQ